jgi:hypothetical protein
MGLLSQDWKEGKSRASKSRKQIHLDRFTSCFIIKNAPRHSFTGQSGKTDHSQQKTGTSY